VGKDRWLAASKKTSNIQRSTSNAECRIVGRLCQTPIF
jgi:hypothetical protein